MVRRAISTSEGFGVHCAPNGPRVNPLRRLAISVNFIEGPRRILVWTDEVVRGSYVHSTGFFRTKSMREGRRQTHFWQAEYRNSGPSRHRSRE